tara:strand:+ start:170 stop:424 length:255 start_codon:yes stop_codon:yes gene_type:complete
MSKSDLETRKYFEIEVTTTVTLWADSKEEAIEKFNEKYVNISYDDCYDGDYPEYDFKMTGKMWQVPFVDEGNWVKLLTAQKKEI